LRTTRKPIAIAAELKTELLVEDPEIAVTASRHGLRHHRLHLLRDHADVSLVAAEIAEPIVAETIGGALGVGFEYGFAPNWSVGIEYDRLFMGDANNSFSVANPILANSLNRIGQDVDLVTIRFNYRFGGPVVARY
jgi:hypothetical protein